MEQLEDVAWVFDSLVGFLHGPIWNSPLQTFIEEKSIIFEPDEDESITSNNEQYKALHEEYKGLVDLMLGTFMEDIGISPEQFELACEMSKHEDGLPLHFHHRLFEQIWAANHFPTFVRMMTRRNVELQIQALELIEKREDTEQSQAVDQQLESDDQDVIQKIERLTLNELLEDNSKYDEKLNQLDARLTSTNEIAKEMPTIQEKPEQEISSEEIPSPEEIKKPQEKPTKEEFASRQEYLQRQRDKLVALKKQIREKQLSEVEESGGKKFGERPKSSRAAQMILSGGAEELMNVSHLNVRKALAERLRTEVVDKAGHSN